MEDLFAHYEHAGDSPTRQQIATQVFCARELYAQREETVFSPAFDAQAGKKGTQLVADSRLDHQQVKDLLSDRQLSDMEKEAFEAKVYYCPTP